MSLYDSSVASKAESRQVTAYLHKLRRQIETMPESNSKRDSVISEYHRILDIWAIPSGVDDGALSPKPFRPRLIDHRRDAQIRKANRAYRAYEVKRSKRFR